MTKTDQLADAREYIAIAESGDAKLAAWHRAAQAIVNWLDVDQTRSQRLAAQQLQRSQNFVGTLVRWHTSEPDAVHPPFGGPSENEARYERADRRKVEDAIRERPEAVAAAIAKAPAEVQRKLADEIVKQPTERSLKSLAEPKDRQGREGKSTEQRLGAATFTLWEVGEALLDEVPTAEARVRMLAIAEKAGRLAAGIVYHLETGEIDSEFRDLLQEVGAES